MRRSKCPALVACAGLLVLSPSGVTAPQVDASGVTTVWIDAADAYLPSNEGSYWVVTTNDVQIPLVLSEPAFGDGFGANTVSSLIPSGGTVVFPPGTTTRTTTRAFGEEPSTEFFPGWLARWGYFNITSAGPNGQVGIPATLYVASVAQGVGGATGDICAWSFFEALLCALRVPGFCPEGVMSPGVARIAGGIVPGVTLQRYRDEVLGSTVNGQYYADLFNTLSPDAVHALVNAPSVAVRILKAEDEWIPALDALVNGTGGAATVTQTMQDDLLGILQLLENAGSATLANALAFERDRLNLDQITGLTLTQFQEQIVTLGGPTSIESRTWGEVKDRYRPSSR